MSLGDQTRAQLRQTLESPRQQGMILSAVAALLVFLGTVTQAPARFLWDAARYWAGSVSLANGGNTFVDAGLNFRGVWMSLLWPGCGQGCSANLPGCNG